MGIFSVSFRDLKKFSCLTTIHIQHLDIEKNEKKVWDYIKREVPMQKFVSAEDIAKTVMYLEQSEFVTGANIVVDGGQLSKFI